MADLVDVDDHLAYNRITKKMISGSYFEEIEKGKFEYKRKGEQRFDELIVILPDGSPITYKLDFRSKLIYEELPDRVIKLKGSIQERQPKA